MTQPNDSALAGGGDVIATHLVDGKEYQVVVLAGPSGNIYGTRDTYVAYAPPVSAVGANKLHFDLWNGSALSMEIQFASFFSSLDVAAVGAVATRIDAFRTSAVGTGGTAFATEATTAVRTVYRADPGAAAVPATVTMREAPAGGATVGAFLGSVYTMPEEASTSIGYETQWQNIFAGPSGSDAAASIVVPASSGMRFVQGPVASVGFVGCRVVFTLV